MLIGTLHGNLLEHLKGYTVVFGAEGFAVDAGVAVPFSLFSKRGTNETLSATIKVFVTF